MPIYYLTPCVWSLSWLPSPQGTLQHGRPSQEPSPHQHGTPRGLRYEAPTNDKVDHRGGDKDLDERA